MNSKDKSIWSNIQRHTKKIGKNVVTIALQLFFTAQLPDVPKKAKAVIYGALAYLIAPIDAIPDILPGGFIDDASVLTAALVTVSMYITPEITTRTQKIVNRWFGAPP